MNPATIHELADQAEAAIARADSLASLERVRVEYLGRKGRLSRAFQTVTSVPPAERPAFGQAVNAAKRRVDAALTAQRQALARTAETPIRLTLPGERPARGHLHPLTQFSRRVLDIWRSFGYDVHDGPELETAWFNFDGLNVPADHPSRDIQDTFFIKDHPGLVLRTHTSTVQLRWPISHHAKPPFKVVEIGKVYRHEATDATHESMFFQCDGVLVDRQVTMAHLITTLKAFMHRLYPQKKQRIRPSFFPFVEPGIEFDLEWEREGKKQWLEILGAGLIQPSVITAMGLNPRQWQGFAFGMGLDRLAMLEYGVPDIRLFYSGNLEFLKQF